MCINDWHLCVHSKLDFILFCVFFHVAPGISADLDCFPVTTGCQSQQFLSAIFQVHHPASAEHNSPQCQVSWVSTCVHERSDHLVRLCPSHLQYSHKELLSMPHRASTPPFCLPSGIWVLGTSYLRSVPTAQGWTTQAEKDKCVAQSPRPDLATGTDTWNLVYKSLLKIANRSSRKFVSVCTWLCGHEKLLFFLLLIHLASFLMFSVIISLTKLLTYTLTLTNKPLPHLLAALIHVHLLSLTHSVWCLSRNLRVVILKSKPTTYSIDPIPTAFLLDCLDNLLPTLSQIVSNSLLSVSFHQYSNTLLFSLFSKSLLLTTAPVNTRVQSQTFRSCQKSV